MLMLMLMLLEENGGFEIANKLQKFDGGQTQNVIVAEFEI
jgi:hypothetical protein